MNVPHFIGTIDSYDKKEIIEDSGLDEFTV